MAKMNIVLNVNDLDEAMLMHDAPLGFVPAWVEFSRDARGVRIVSEEGNEFVTGPLLNFESWDVLSRVSGVLVVQMHNQQPVQGYELPFINQDYEQVHGT